MLPTFMAVSWRMCKATAQAQLIGELRKFSGIFEVIRPGGDT